MQEKSINIGHRSVGEEQNTYVIAEIGINHNGDIAVAKELIDAAHRCGCDAVKFQKRNPDRSADLRPGFGPQHARQR